MITLPLVRGFGPSSVFAYREGRVVRIEEFLRDVRQLAAELPQRRHVFNLCADRYRFAVGFSAALLRRQVSLLPPNETPDAHAVLDTVFFPVPADSGPAAPLIPDVPQAHPAAILFTSGSTGDPVPFRKTWGGLVRSALAEVDRLDVRARPGMAVLGTVPPQHSYGLESTLLMAMQGGLALHAGRPFFPADVRAELAALQRPRCLVTTPVHLRVLLAEPDELPPADRVLCATAPLSPQLAAQAEARFAAPLYEIYGCTEAGQIATRRTTETPEWRLYPSFALRQDEKGTWVKGGHARSEFLLSDIIELRASGAGPQPRDRHGCAAPADRPGFSSAPAVHGGFIAAQRDRQAATGVARYSGNANDGKGRLAWPPSSTLFPPTIRRRTGTFQATRSFPARSS